MFSDHERSFSLLSDSFGTGKFIGFVAVACGEPVESIEVRCFQRYSLLPKKYPKACSMACMSGRPLTLKNANPAESAIIGIPSSTVR